EILSHLVHSTDDAHCKCVEMSYCLHSGPCQTPPRNKTITLVNLPNAKDTIRVIRPYRKVRGRVEQIGRIDWEPPHAYSSAPRQAYEFSQLPDKLDSLPDESRRLIIVEDFLKGTVTPSVIASLDRRYRNAWWFIRTKDQQPPWLSKSIKEKVRLLVIG